MKSSLVFLHILWFYTMLRSEIFTCAKTYVLIDPLLCNKNTTASHSRFTLELLTPGGLLLHVTPLKCVALWFRTWTLSKWAKLSAIECTKTHGKSHTKFLNLLEFSQKNGSIVRSLQNTGRVELDVHHVSPKCGLVCLSHHIWYHKNPSLRQIDIIHQIVDCFNPSLGVMPTSRAPYQSEGVDLSYGKCWISSLKGVRKFGKNLASGLKSRIDMAGACFCAGAKPCTGCFIVWCRTAKWSCQAMSLGGVHFSSTRLSASRCKRRHHDFSFFRCS
jgi:hypothetical protein